MNKNARILIVDDELVQRIINRRTLELSGFSHISEASDGDVALALMSHTIFDIVITDGIMPRMSGFKLIEAMKEHQALSHIPVIMLTSESWPEDRKRGLELGASSYLPKPVNKKMLCEAIEKALS